MRISDWSSDVCSSDLVQIVGLAGIDRCHLRRPECIAVGKEPIFAEQVGNNAALERLDVEQGMRHRNGCAAEQPRLELIAGWAIGAFVIEQRQPCLLLARSEEHTSELQSLMRISYAVFCLKKKKTN